VANSRRVCGSCVNRDLANTTVAVSSIDNCLIHHRCLVIIAGCDGGDGRMQMFSGQCKGPRPQNPGTEPTSSLRGPFRLVVSHAGEPLNLAKATCTRTRWPNGRLMEIVNLNGGDYGLGEEQLG
jgi:hypothetical protein